MAKKKTIESEAISLKLEENGDFTCELRSHIGRFVRVQKVDNERVPELEGDALLVSNSAVVENLWLAAVAHVQAEELDVEDAEKNAKLKCKELRAQAKASAIRATKLAELTDLLEDKEEQGWCSSCLTLASHQGLKGKNTFICMVCGEATKKCSVVRCKHFGVDPLGISSLTVTCAEHQHVIPNFEELDHRIDDLTDFKELMEFRSANAGRVAKLAGAGVAGMAVLGTAGFALAPMAGSLVGTTILGLSGAAATNAGLAALGFGSLAAGGLGMAGGTMVVAAAGALLGTAMGVGTLNAYVGEDDSFNIKKVRDGAETPVIVIRGFVTEGKQDWRKEVAAVEKSYPHSPIYLVEWGSKELKELTAFLNPAGAAGAAMGVKFFVKRASKNLAEKAGPVGMAVGAANLLANPWHTAVNRANKTALALAAILQRTDMDECVLVGHSLGGRIVVNLCSALAGVSAAEHQVRIKAAHVLGGAVSRKYSWDVLGSDLIGSVHNYYSSRDQVLKTLYRTAMPMQKAVGAYGFQTDLANVVDHNVTTEVEKHSKYFSNVSLIVD